jgi:hypothetical protein
MSPEQVNCPQDLGAAALFIVIGGSDHSGVSAADSEDARGGVQGIIGMNAGIVGHLHEETT